ncbi:hypothetical protein [Phaeocystidibacter marisrubri]|uniref:Uncharacterized protein n=1 Tax=Phaeocystidibacter marisrubri TaxID=1577780 RepID=A0A6L3ZH07_9FLAO|nr:hypothetical protein [Phaeocystidibacter marisrubri]KAB2817306.1 hypothetical protein F8C82_02630 [Phaeocystidibacter marisrubri]GGH76013.1 hypothetical protein GCM10011318_23630 [Phaeocystidibacter marisrubri]
MSNHKKKDGIHIPQDFLEKNATRLKSISDVSVERRTKIKRIPVWIPVASAACVAALLYFAIPGSTPAAIDPFNEIAKVDLMDVYRAGYIDLDGDLLYSAFGEDQTLFDTEEIENIDDEQLNVEQLLNEFSDEEIYNLLNG